MLNLRYEKRKYSRCKADKTVTIGPFETAEIQGITEVSEHYKRVSAITELPLQRYSHKVVTKEAFTQLYPGSR